MDRETWHLTLALLAAVDDDTDPRVVALAHLGAAVLLFERCDPATADERPRFGMMPTESSQLHEIRPRANVRPHG